MTTVPQLQPVPGTAPGFSAAAESGAPGQTPGFVAVG